MIIRQMKTAAILIALLILTAGTIAYWGHESDTSNDLVAQPTIPETRRSQSEGGRKRVRLFFVDRDDHSFREEYRNIESGATATEGAKLALTELMKGPESTRLAPTIPRETQLLNLFIDSAGTAYVDFNQALRDGLTGGAQGKLYAVFSIVNSLTSNFARITRVQILVEGSEVPTLTGHIDTRMALPPQDAF